MEMLKLKKAQSFSEVEIIWSTELKILLSTIFPKNKMRDCYLMKVSETIELIKITKVSDNSPFFRKLHEPTENKYF